MDYHVETIGSDLPLEADRSTARGRRAKRSGLAKNALDRLDANPIDPCDLCCRHSVLHPRADARKVRARDLGRYPRFGAARLLTFSLADRCRRRHPQNTRFPRRLTGRCQLVGN